MAPSRLNVLYLCAGLYWLGAHHDDHLEEVTARTTHTIELHQTSISNGTRWKIQEKERAVPVHHARVSKRMIYGQTQRGRLLNILNNKNQENKKKNKLSVSQLSTHAYQTRRETEICEQRRIIIISRCRNSPSSIARCEQLNRFLFILFFYFFYGRRF
jgi:hypothetical protein